MRKDHGKNPQKKPIQGGLYRVLRDPILFRRTIPTSHLPDDPTIL